MGQVIDVPGWCGFLLGLAALAAGTGAMRKPGIWRQMVEEVERSPTLQFLCGMMELVIGATVYILNPIGPHDILASALKIIGGFWMAEAFVIIAFCDIYSQAWLRNLANMHRGWAAFTILVGVALTAASAYHFTLNPVN